MIMALHRIREDFVKKQCPFSKFGMDGGLVEVEWSPGLDFCFLHVFPLVGWTGRLLIEPFFGS